MKNASRYVGVRVPLPIAERLDKITDRVRDPYAPTQTQVILRGIELALAEIEKKARRRE